MKKTINVTQDHIDKGYRGSCDACPIALAFTDAGHKDVVVGPDFAILDNYTKWISIPPVVNRFISDFDRGLLLQGFSFEVEI